ncbi:XdhC family protein [Herbiconiux sp. KACC 21604]|uniref:XdhC family protein n=1 Tax=unclassified Herbiconiux TaxID=2618217 RepID=UPI001492C54B|nr:XdhC/CoxI family protein [Herbiconiux sp. SALV-R1]QJU54025.1 XdhC family protein [Herbiconiux sp. SALV-R1]WPO85059.1 XdhC family protein [Herbiconiux sp. KACC 21604]
MLELAAPLLAALAAGESLAVATVVSVDGSAPRALGTSMAVTVAGRVIGSISGGCVEGAVYDVCGRVLESGEPELCEFGFSDDDAFAVGLACGGRLTVWVQRLAPDGQPSAVEASLRVELERARDKRAAGIAVVLGDGPVRLVGAHAHPSSESGVAAGVATESVDARVAAELAGALRAGRSTRRAIACEGEVLDAVLLVSAPPPHLIIFGAVDFSVALSNAAALLGYRTTVCDARPVFATPERFPAAEVVNRWPTDYLAEAEVDERTVVCILTHDDKFDVPLIEAALALPVAYVGAMGSRRTHSRRVDALRERGVREEALAALHSPIGLDLGASSPEETAVSILAEVLAVKTGASTRSLRDTSGAIHRPLENADPAGAVASRVAGVAGR